LNKVTSLGFIGSKPYLVFDSEDEQHHLKTIIVTDGTQAQSVLTLKYPADVVASQIA
jgi:hypothetical protein